MAKKKTRFEVGSEVTVPTMRFSKKHREMRVVRRRATVKKIATANDGTTLLQVVFTTGTMRGMFAYFDAKSAKKPRKSANKVYAFGRITEWGTDETI